MGSPSSFSQNVGGFATMSRRNHVTNALQRLIIHVSSLSASWTAKMAVVEVRQEKFSLLKSGQRIRKKWMKIIGTT